MYKIRQSLTVPILFMGVPKAFFFLNTGMALECIVVLGAWYLSMLFIVLHIAVQKIVKIDPEFFQILKRHLQQPTYYDV